ncbi:MAG: HEPN domain-containing protein [Ignavibacteria bacterium]|nr:HEPN domain-containing protein [Ignavibacteria bacterium]
MTYEERSILRTYRLEQADTALRDAQVLVAHNGSVLGIINRAYYAMFYATLALLQERSSVPSKHSGVITLFDVEFVKAGLLPKHLSKSLHRAFDFRQESDYKATAMIDMPLAQEILFDAEGFVEAVRAYLFPPLIS